MKLKFSRLTALIVAVFVPIALELAAVLVIYGPGVSLGWNTRQVWLVVTSVPAVAAVALLQTYPFNSGVIRFLASIVFGVVMFMVLFWIYLMTALIVTGG